MNDSIPQFIRDVLFNENVNWEDDPRHDTNIQRKTEKKFSLLEPYVRGKTCLDIGCAGGGAGFVTDDYWLHGWLNNHASDVSGIDIDQEGIEMAQDAGYNVKLQSAETFELDRKFEVVIAANVIEHLASPGKMLDSAHEHLESDGRLIITTPRTHIPWNLLRQLKNEDGIEPHPEHTMWFCRSTLSALLNRKGFEIVKYQSWGFDRVGMSRADKIWRTVERQFSKLPGLHEIDDYQHFVVAKPV